MLLTKQTSGTTLALVLTAYFTIFGAIDRDISAPIHSPSERLNEPKSQSQLNLKNPFVVQSEDGLQGPFVVKAEQELKGPFVVNADQILDRPILAKAGQDLRGPFVVDATQTLHAELPVSLFT